MKYLVLPTLLLLGCSTNQPKTTQVQTCSEVSPIVSIAGPGDQALATKIDNYMMSGVEKGYAGTLLIAKGGKVMALQIGSGILLTRPAQFLISVPTLNNLPPPLS